jgi:hypothetical protein
MSIPIPKIRSTNKGSGGAAQLRWRDARQSIVRCLKTGVFAMKRGLARKNTIAERSAMASPLSSIAMAVINTKCWYVASKWSTKGWL